MLDTILNILNWINGFCALMCVHIYSQCVCVSEKALDIKSEARHADENGEWHEGGGGVHGKLTVTTFTITGIRGHMLWNHNMGEQMVKTQKHTDKYTPSQMEGNPRLLFFRQSRKPLKKPTCEPKHKENTLLHQQDESPGRKSHFSNFPGALTDLNQAFS